MAYKSDCQESQREAKADTLLFNFEGPKPSHGGVAQLGEHLPCKQGVRSSILLISTNIRAHSSVG